MVSNLSGVRWGEARSIVHMETRLLTRKREWVPVRWKQPMFTTASLGWVAFLSSGFCAVGIWTLPIGQVHYGTLSLNINRQSWLQHKTGCAADFITLRNVAKISACHLLTLAGQWGSSSAERIIRCLCWPLVPQPQFSVFPLVSKLGFTPGLFWRCHGSSLCSGGILLPPWLDSGHLLPMYFVP